MAVVFGTAIWLAVLTVIAVSIVYRLVMRWVVDGSGGSGLCEEEFGPWAVKINASITFVEYTLTFLVSMAALVTFLADRIPQLNAGIGGISLRMLVAIGLSIGICLLVNRGPRVAAAAFGPATAAVLLLLWVMIGASIHQRGLRLPVFKTEAFTGAYLHLTLAGYARILALMTGIEIFANLVAAYDGSPAERSRKAFGSLIIVMFTTCATMLIVGPAIAAVADVNNENVSVFTQTMDMLLPPYAAMAGSAVGIAVLLSACAASVQGIQNLALGLRYRHYVPAWFGRRNLYGVADKSAWLVTIVCVLCFAVFGTREETYLALYAAGVFVLLSLTSWAVVKRLGARLRGEQKTSRHRTLVTLTFTCCAAMLTSVATLIIFEERFAAGAWAYFVIIPGMYFLLGFYRHRLGPPPLIVERLGQLVASGVKHMSPAMAPGSFSYKTILLPLDMQPISELAIPFALRIQNRFSGTLTTFMAIDEKDGYHKDEATAYLERIKSEINLLGSDATTYTREGPAADEIAAISAEIAADIILLVAHERSSLSKSIKPGVVKHLIHHTTAPVIVLRPSTNWRSTRSEFSRFLVTLDGSPTAEQILPHALALASACQSTIRLLTVPEGGSVTTELRESLRQYLEAAAAPLRQAGLTVFCDITTEDVAPAKAIIEHALTHGCDLIMMVTHGSGGVERQKFVKLGSVAEQVLDDTPCPLFLTSAVPDKKVTYE